MPTSAQRKAAAKKAAATRRANRAAATSSTTSTGEPAAPKPEKKGPGRRQLPDGKGPNDFVLFADLIALGYVEAGDIQVDDDDAG